MKTISVLAQEDASWHLATQIREVLPGSSQLPQAGLAADILLVPDQFQMAPTRRLVVLVPAGEVDEQALARRVWQLASCSGLDVLYLSLSPDANHVSYLRRRLAGLAASTTYSNVQAEIRVHEQKNGSQAFRQNLKPGDLLICLEKDSTTGFFRRQPLAQRLAMDLRLPVYQLGGLKVKPELHSNYWIKNALAWIASMALIAVFFWLQLGIDRASARPQSTILLCLSVLVELYGLWKINEWIG
jgi:hypothetical protein